MLAHHSVMRPSAADKIVLVCSKASSANVLLAMQLDSKSHSDCFLVTLLLLQCNGNGQCECNECKCQGYGGSLCETCVNSEVGGVNMGCVWHVRMYVLFIDF